MSEKNESAEWKLLVNLFPWLLAHVHPEQDNKLFTTIRVVKALADQVISTS